MPVLSRKDERGSIELKCRFLALLQDAFDNRGFNLLPLAILNDPVVRRELARGRCRL